MSIRVFAVRIIDGHEIVGIFMANNLVELWDWVDHVTDPGECEYAPIDKAGGILWEGRAVSVGDELTGEPDEIDDNHPGVALFNGASIDGDIDDVLFPFMPSRKKTWKKLVYADEKGSSLFEIYEKAKANDR